MNSKKIIKTGFLLISALILFISVTYAWILTNRNVDTKNIIIGLENDDTTASYMIYKWDIRKSIGTNTDDDENLLSIYNVDINPYDLIIKSRNYYTPVLARIELQRHISMPQSGTVTVTITRTLDNNDVTSSELSNFSSSIMRFTTIIDKTNYLNPNTLYSSINDTMYDNTKAYVVTENDESAHLYDAFSKTFVTAKKFGAVYAFTKEEYITLSIPYTIDDWTTIEGNETLIVYLYMSYDIGLIELYKNSSGFSIGDNGSNIIDFGNDFKTISVSYQSGQ